MKIWLMGHAERNNEWVAAVGGNFPSISLGFDGDSRADGWKELQLEGIHRTRSPLKSDSPLFCSHVPLLSDRARDCLADLLERDAEVLPVDFEGQRLWLVNVVAVPDCIDYQRSVYEVRGHNGSIRGFHEYQFRKDAVSGLDIFKVPDEVRGAPFVSDRFVKRVKECGLTGLEFKLVWDSELPPGSVVFEGIPN